MGPSQGVPVPRHEPGDHSGRSRWGYIDRDVGGSYDGGDEGFHASYVINLGERWVNKGVPLPS